MNLRDTWLRADRGATEASGEVICFPPAGCGASFFYGLRGCVGKDWRVEAVQVPGRESRIGENLIRSTRHLARAFVQDVGTSLGPEYALFGHSLGALLAFEVCRELRHLGLTPPVGLIVSGKNAPQVCNPNPTLYDRPEDEIIEKVSELFDPLEVWWHLPELRELILPALRADMEMCDTYLYRPDTKFDYPILAMGGTEDISTPVEVLEEWSEQSSVQFNLTLFPGGHSYLARDWERVGQRIAVWLDSIV